MLQDLWGVTLGCDDEVCDGFKSKQMRYRTDLVFFKVKALRFILGEIAAAYYMDFVMHQ